MLRIKTLISKFLNFREKSILGLDVGPGFIRAIKLAHSDGGYLIAGGGNTEIPQIKTASTKEQNTITVDAIGRCVKDCRSNTNMAVCAVNALDSAVRGFTLPPMPLEEVDYAILQEAEHSSPVAINSTVVDYQFIEDYQEDIQMSGMLVAAKAEAVMAKCRLVENASLQVVMMDAESLALINCFRQLGMTQDGETAAIIQVNDSYSNMIILGKESLPFVRKVSYDEGEVVRSGGNDLEKKDLKVEAALFDKDQENKIQPPGKDCFAKSVKSLVRRITETLRYYAARNNNTTVDRIYLCGEIALIDRGIGLFSSELSQKIQVWNPVKDIGFTSKVVNRQMLEKNGPSMVVAIGLAMRTI